MIAVRELQNGRRDRDTALLFEFHPVRCRRASASFALHRACLGAKSTAVEQELFGQRRLAGIGVRDDRKGAAAVGFVEGFG